MRHGDSTLGFYGSHFAVEPSQILHLARLWRFISYFMCMMLEAVRRGYLFNTLRLRQNGHRFADDTFKLIFLNEYVRILFKISLKFVLKGRINNNPSLDQIIAWRRSGDKPLSEPMMVRRIYASLGLNELNSLKVTSVVAVQPTWKRNKTRTNFYYIIRTSIGPYDMDK